MEKIVFPPRFVKTIIGVHGEKGQKWLDGFDSLLSACESRWSIAAVEQTSYPLSYNYVTPVKVQDGTEAVLKLGVPSAETHAEIETLREFAGEGMVRLLDADPELGVLLLERITPGMMLHETGSEEEQTQAAADLIGKMRRPAPPHTPFPTLADWSRGLEGLRRRYHGGTGPLPAQMVEQAENWFPKLISSIRQPQLLHGDLHHGNMLSATREPWLAIDPKGVIGDTEYECVAFLRNQLPAGDERDVLRRRVEHLVKELELERDRVLAWGFSHSILSACWHLEEQTDGWEEAVQQAEDFKGLM